MTTEIKNALASLDAARATVRQRGKNLVAAVERERKRLQRDLDKRPDPGFLKSDPESDRLQELIDDMPEPEVGQLSAHETWDDALGPLRRFLAGRK